MPESVIDEGTRIRLAQSLSVIEMNRDTITLRLQERLAAMETEDEPFGQAEVTVLMLASALIEGASDLAAGGTLRGLHRVAAEHRRLDIDGRHYSRFGVALSPALRETLGPRLSPAMVSAWCDAFWFIIRALTQEAPQQSRTSLHPGWTG